MHYLGLALYAEGPGDYRFLSPLLQRICEDVCIGMAAGLVDVSEVIPVNHAEEIAGSSRSVRVASAAREHKGAWTLLFIHGDGSGDPALAATNLVQPALDLVHAEFPEGRGIAVVPVRETEAWAICDGDALREVFGTTLRDERLGIPVGYRAVEGDPDPKATLRNAFFATNPAPQRKRKGVGSILHGVGDAVRLSRLRELPSFQRMERELVASLEQLGVLR